MSDMVLIPGGSFQMGSESGYPEEKPVHAVTLPDFYMDSRPVTNAEFKTYCDAVGKAYPKDPFWAALPQYFLDYPNYPVVCVSWREAVIYAAWAGKRLPTEEEWEYAARGGSDGPYPWGKALPDGGKANYADKSCEFVWKDPAQNDGYAFTSPAGNYPSNGYGLYDMAGNVFEWTADWFFAYDDAVRDTEVFKDGWGGAKVARGGCYHSTAKDLRVSRRRQVLGGGPNASVGFRCVKDIGNVKQMPMDDAEKSRQIQPGDWDKKLPGLHIRLPEGKELCAGVSPDTDPEYLAKLRGLGCTSVEQYVTWETCEQSGEGQWDFSHWDGELQKIRTAGLKWLPFLIAGPAYAMPEWYRKSREFEGIVCLEHGIESKIQSLFDRNFYKYIDRFLKKVSEHFVDHAIFEGLLLGITGDFGEAIMSVWHGNWPTNIPGLYHAHAGYWCGDRFARADFKDKMENKFGGDLVKLNAAWDTGFKSWAALDFPPVHSDPDNFRVDEQTEAGSYHPQTPGQRRRWVDFIDWYRDSMTAYANFWMQTARKYFPDTELYLCTGGDAVPWHASEFAAQSKIAAAVGGGVRITNEASNFAFNFAITNWVASASNFYGGYFSLEPAGQVTERGVVCRIYNAAATGAKSLHFYSGQVTNSEERTDNHAKNIGMFKSGIVKRGIGLLYPDVPLMLDPARQPEMYASFTLMRDYTDYLYACDLTIKDGILDGLKALVITMDGIYRTETLEKIRKFTENGGLLIGLKLRELRDLDKDEDWLKILFDKPNTLLLSAGLCGKVVPTSTSSVFRMLPPTPEDIACMQREVCEPMTAFLKTHGVSVPDGKLDNIYMVEKDGKLLVMNYSGETITRDISSLSGEKITATIPDLEIVEMG